MNKSNQSIQFKGNKLKVSGRELKEGDLMPPFKLVGRDLADVESGAYKGKVLILTSVPSLDTPVCAIETKRFNEEAAKLPSDIKILTISLDLPFAQKRWCGAEGVDKVETLSDYKYRNFGENFGTFIQDMALLARAVFVVNREGKIVHVEYVSDISQEPDYQAALNAAKSA